MLVQVTHLSTYLYCKRKLFLGEVCGITEPPKETLVLGSIRHQIYDKINKFEQEIISHIAKFISFAELLATYKKSYNSIVQEVIMRNEARLAPFTITPSTAFENIWPGVQEEMITRVQNVYDFMIEHKVVGAELWEKLSPKFLSEVRLLSEKYSLKGIVDKIAVFPSYCIPIEIKTGNPPKDGVWPGHRIQLAAYMILLEDNMELSVTRGIVEYTGSNQRYEVRMNPFLQREVMMLKAEVQKLLESSVIPDMCNNNKKCSCCGLRDFCFDERRIKTKVLNIT